LSAESELITYHVTSECGSERFEEFTSVGGPYRELGQFVDVQIEVRQYHGKDGRSYITLRSARDEGEF
jgi:hypothetical protein